MFGHCKECGFRKVGCPHPKCSNFSTEARKLVSDHFKQIHGVEAKDPIPDGPVTWSVPKPAKGKEAWEMRCFKGPKEGEALAVVFGVPKDAKYYTWVAGLFDSDKARKFNTEFSLNIKIANGYAEMGGTLH